MHFGLRFFAPLCNEKAKPFERGKTRSPNIMRFILKLKHCCRRRGKLPLSNGVGVLPGGAAALSPQVRPKFAIGEFCVWPERRRPFGRNSYSIAFKLSFMSMPTILRRRMRVTSPVKSSTTTGAASQMNQETPASEPMFMMRNSSCIRKTPTG